MKFRTERTPSILVNLPGLRNELFVSGLLSLGDLLSIAAAFILIARLLAAGLLQRQVPDIQTLLVPAAMLLLRAGLAALRERRGLRLASSAVQVWRGHLTRTALALGPVVLSGTRSADLATLDAELGPRLTPYYARYLPGTIHAVLAFLVVLGATAWLDPATAGVLLVTGPVTVVFLVLVGLATNSATEQQWVTHTRLASRLLTLTRYLPTLHAFGAVAIYRDVLARSATQHRESTLRVLRIAFLSGFVMDFAATIATALVAVWIGVRLFGGAAQLAPTLAALMLVPAFFGPLRQLGADRHAALDAEPVGARLQALLAQRVAPSGPARPADRALPLTFRSARADLPAATALLSVTLLPGTFAALRGPSGSGKTTLLHALRKHVPYCGEILVGTQPLDALDAREWQARVAFVPQHPRLMAATLRENLRLGKPGADDAELETALKAVSLWDMVQELPAGLDTPLGEGGVLLSGGETARLALVRALVSGAPYVLLDEVTAHLDPLSEAEVYYVLRSAFEGRTVLLATHRATPSGWLDLPLEAHVAPPGPVTPLPVSA